MENKSQLFPVINVWTNEQKNTKPKNRQPTPFDDQPSSSKVRLNGMALSQERDVEYSQGKYTQNQSTAPINLSHVFGNMHLGDHQSSVEPLRRISTQSHATSIASFQNPHHQNHQNSHGNYVDIDAIDSILSENENFHHFGGAPQYDRSANENRMQSMMDVAIGSPIYENQTSLINRSESPIYSNTHSQSTAMLYPKTQNIYSNLPAITSGPSTSAYANIQPSNIQHHALQPSELGILIGFMNFNGKSFQFFSSPVTSSHCHQAGQSTTRCATGENIISIIILKRLTGRTRSTECKCSGRELRINKEATSTSESRDQDYHSMIQTISL